MGLRFDPIGGGQFKAAVKQIMEAESKPLRTMEARKQTEEAKLKLFQEFKGKFTGLDKALDEIGTFKKMRELKVDLGDGSSQMTVTLDKDKAQTGTYNIKIDQLAARTSAISNGFENPDEPLLGLGFVVMDLPNGDSIEIFIDQDQGSLRGVANAINNNPQSPVRASVMRDASESPPVHRLILSAKKEGAENQISFPDFYFLDGEEDLYLDDSRDSQNAVISIDGFPIEAEGNDIADFLPGINVHLKQAKPDQEFTITITEDFQKISGKVKAMVEKMNEVLSFINKQNAIDQNTDTRSTFAGDTGLQTIEYRLRNLMHEGFPLGDITGEGPVGIAFLNEIGIEFDKTGTVSFKEDKFNKYMEKDFERTAEVISGPYGFANQLKKVLRTMTDPLNGTLGLRERGLRSRIQAIDSQIDMKTRQLDRRQQSLTDQFSKLQASLANMQQQQQYLSASLGGGGGNLVSQLLG